MILLPGKDLTKEILQIVEVEDRENKSSKIKLGPGLFSDNNRIIATTTGRLLHYRGLRFWGNYLFSAYLPSLGDYVIGKVYHKSSDVYKLDIGISKIATLDVLAFDAATRRNRPNLNLGSLVYCKIVRIDQSDVKLSCIHEFQGSISNEIFGEISNPGILLKIPVSFSQHLQINGHPHFNELGRKESFEIIIGCNGYIFISSNKPNLTADIANLIKRCLIH